MDRDKKLAEKAAEVGKRLEEWAKGIKLLRVGEGLIYSLRIAPISLISRDPRDQTASSPLKGLVLAYDISPSTGNNSHYEYIQPAKLSAEEAATLIQSAPKNRHNNLRQLLIRNKNKPTALKEFDENLLNQRFRTVIPGKQFRIIRSWIPPDEVDPVKMRLREHGYFVHFQLWEVRKRE